jgi:hypothetical protein
MTGGKRDEPDRTFPHSLVFFSPLDVATLKVLW